MREFLEIIAIIALWYGCMLLLLPVSPFTSVIMSGWFGWNLLQIFRGKR